jgi:transposase
VKEIAREMGIYLVIPATIFSRPKSIEFIWKAIKRVISVSLIKYVDELIKRLKR